MQQVVEFQCTECHFWNYPVLSMDLTGANYTIECGQCQHHHYRVVRNGKITEDRHDTKLGNAEIIHIMKSACQKEQRKLSPIQLLRQKEAAGLHQ